MSFKSEKVSMPMSSAGILGISQDENIGGIKIDPRTIVIAVLVFVAAIKILTLFVKS